MSVHCPKREIKTNKPPATRLRLHQKGERKRKMPSKRPRKRAVCADKKQKLGRLTDKDVHTMSIDELEEVVRQTVGPDGREMSETEQELHDRFRRMIKNRISAYNSRVRKKREKSALQVRAATLERSNRSLTNLIVDMEMERKTGSLTPVAILRPPAANTFLTWQREHNDLLVSVGTLETGINELQKSLYELRRTVFATKKEQLHKITKLKTMVSVPLTQADTRPFYIEEVFNDRFETLAKAVSLLNRKIDQNEQEEEETPYTSVSSPPPALPPLSSFPFPLAAEFPQFSDDETVSIPSLLSKVGTNGPNMSWV